MLKGPKKGGFWKASLAFSTSPCFETFICFSLARRHYALASFTVNAALDEAGANEVVKPASVRGRQV
jgi:hypothetical protein